MDALQQRHKLAMMKIQQTQFSQVGLELLTYEWPHLSVGDRADGEVDEHRLEDVPGNREPVFPEKVLAVEILEKLGIDEDAPKRGLELLEIGVVDRNSQQVAFRNERLHAEVEGGVLQKRDRQLFLCRVGVS